MGFRIILYNVKKKDIRELKKLARDTDTNLKEAVSETFDKIYSTCSKEEIVYDCFTDWFLELSDNKNYCTKLASDNILGTDMLFRVVDKQQFENIIKKFYQNDIERKEKLSLPEYRRKDLKEHLDDEVIIRYNERYSESKTVTDVLVENFRNDLMSLDMLKIDADYIDEVFKNKWCATKSWNISLGIVNLCHIYHMMDWKHYNIVLIGG